MRSVTFGVLPRPPALPPDVAVEIEAGGAIQVPVVLACCAFAKLAFIPISIEHAAALPGDYLIVSIPVDVCKYKHVASGRMKIDFFPGLEVV